MSLFAGIFRIEGQIEDSVESIKLITQHISRANDKVDTFKSSRFFLAKVDIGAFGEPALAISDEDVCAMVGEALLEVSGKYSRSRLEEARLLSAQLSLKKVECLLDCYGTFGLCHYNVLEHELILAADKLGGRPIYYTITDEVVYFSTSLRVLEQLPTVPKRVDVQGLTEQTAFGFPLGRNTPYADIKILNGGEFLRVCKNTLVSKYHRWDNVALLDTTEPTSCRRLHEIFLEAVACRGRRDMVVLSQLTGGLDSRCVVGALCQLQKKVYAMTMALPETQEGVYSARYAKMIGATHMIVNQRHSFEAVADIASNIFDGNRDIAHPRLLLSGNGGSVGVGHVYMDEMIVKLMREGKLDECIKYFIKNERITLPTNVFNQFMAQKITHIPFESMKNELKGIQHVEPGRRFFIFLLQNDQRRHLHYHYENIDLYRVEYLDPFFDPRVLEFVISGNVDWFLGHKFYNKWLEMFPSAVLEVPWQAYPGHVPCPLPIETGLSYQWGSTPVSFFAMNRLSWGNWKTCALSVFAPQFPSSILSRTATFFRLLMHLFRMRDYSYLFSVIENWCEFSVKCRGKMAFPSRENE